MSALRTTKSLEALSASLNRALAGARAPQVTAARRAALRHEAPVSVGPASAIGRSDTVAVRRRTNLLIGTLDRLRHPATGLRAGRGPTDH